MWIQKVEISPHLDDSSLVFKGSQNGWLEWPVNWAFLPVYC